MSITLEQVKKSEEITSYIRKADESLSALGFTEHSFAHVGLVSAQASAWHKKFPDAGTFSGSCSSRKRRIFRPNTQTGRIRYGNS